MKARRNTGTGHRRTRQFLRLSIGAALMLSSIGAIWPDQAGAQFWGAAERAAARAAARRAGREAAERSVARSTHSAAARVARREAEDLFIHRWSSSLCSRTRPCPLPERIGNTFRGGSYNEKILGHDTTFYRVYTRPEYRLGVPGERYSYWSRSDARNSQAVIDSAIPVSRNGNTAGQQAAITMPRGTKVFEGVTASIPKGPVGGGSQVVIKGVRTQ